MLEKERDESGSVGGEDDDEAAEDEGAVIGREVARDLAAAEDEEYESNTLDEIIEQVVAKEENDSGDLQVSEGERSGASKTPKKAAKKLARKKSAASDRSDLEASFTAKTDDEKERKGKAEDDPTVMRLRSLLKEAGIFKINLVNNGVLNAIKSKKARYEHLKGIFADAGFDMPINRENCKKFKVKMERKNEIAELDLSKPITGLAPLA